MTSSTPRSQQEPASTTTRSSSSRSHLHIQPSIAKLSTTTITFIISLLLSLLLITTVSSSPTPESLKELADQADKSIRFIKHEDVKEFVKLGVHLLFFGAAWCPHTRRFTPKWLKIQEEFDSRGWNQIEHFGIGKVECSVEEFVCNSPTHKVIGYPTLNLYINGTLIEEYPNEDETTAVLSYLEYHLQHSLPNSIASLSKSVATTTTTKELSLQEASELADLEIRKIEHGEVKEYLERGVYVVFFGAKWCKQTQGFNPKWLEVQKEFDRKGWNKIPNFGIIKVECSNDEKFCTETHKVNGYPTVNLYDSHQQHEQQQTHPKYDDNGTEESVSSIPLLVSMTAFTTIAVFALIRLYRARSGGVGGGGSSIYKKLDDLRR
ncbi:Thioredoxin domain-containing protein 5 [Blyttiomyces sp. JEL0837]|nr:Thioredoxin domain-containing protein 5 [Blyttiomyces sp. JEL0837]